MRPRIIKKTSITNEEKLNDLLNYTNQQDECCIWKGAVNTDGYAHMLGNVKVHRLVYQLKHDKDITGLVIRHRCDMPLCINPEHLIEGLPKDNVRDMDERGRRYRKITREIVIRVKELLATNKLTHKEIGLLVSLDERRVSDIKRGRYNDDGHLT